MDNLYKGRYIEITKGEKIKPTQRAALIKQVKPQVLALLM